MADFYTSRADDDFNKAITREFFQRIQHIITRDKGNLLSLAEIKSILRPRGETYRGMQVVPIKMIVGSEGRYRDFNQHFLPRHEHMRSRWVRVDMAHYKDVILPPIQLYEIGGVYFVRDGNHRVSVARLKHQEAIDAEVISLNTELRLKPGMSKFALLKEVLSYEKALFYERTHFLEITGNPNLDFTEPGRYDELINHVLVHKYYINQTKKEEIPFDEALKSWYETVFSPIIKTIEDEKLDTRFYRRSEADLYVWIVKHWDILKHKYGTQYPLQDAVRDFSEKYGKDFWTRLKDELKSLFKKK